MPLTCDFSFDHPNLIYYSGETISGHIALHTTSEKNIRGAYIIFEGIAKVRWDESRSRKRDDITEHYTVHYSGDEIYLNTETRIVGEGKLSPGTHEYTFNIPLPPQCASSCSEKYGSISYEVTLKVERVLRFANIFTQPLTIIKKLNLNQNPELLIPVTTEDIQCFCCWPCSSGPVISTLTIPLGGWAPGQGIPYKLEVDNQSAVYDFSCITLKLKQIYQFMAHSPERKSRTQGITLSTLGHEDRTVLHLTKRIFDGKLHIPPVPPTSMDSGIIRVSYRIEMHIKVDICHTLSEIWMPITIGTIPIAHRAINHNHVFAIPPTAPSLDTPDTLDKPPSYDIYLRPTFDEATHIWKESKNTNKFEYQNKSGKSCVSKCPMYNNFAMSTTACASSIPPAGTEECDVTESRPLLNIGLDRSIAPPNEANDSQSISSHCAYPTAFGFGGIPSSP